MSGEHVVTLSEIVKTLLEQGFHPRDIRRQLQSRGITWRYRFSNAMPNPAADEQSGNRLRAEVPQTRRTQHVGNRELKRRRRKMGLCENGCGGRRHGSSEYCLSCLENAFRP